MGYFFKLGMGTGPFWGRFWNNFKGIIHFCIFLFNFLKFFFVGLVLTPSYPNPLFSFMANNVLHFLLLDNNEMHSSPLIFCKLLFISIRLQSLRGILVLDMSLDKKDLPENIDCLKIFSKVNFTINIHKFLCQM